MKKIILSLGTMLFLNAAIATAQQKGTVASVKVATYNVAGLPASIIGLSINPDGPGEEGSKIISERLAAEGCDIIALNEDWNNDEAIMSKLGENYNAGTYRGGMDFSNFKVVDGVTRFMSDGLNLLWKKENTVTDERWETWTDCYGYFTNCNDQLAMKGYRCYTYSAAENVDVDVYILHMDADASDQNKLDGIENDFAARESQFNQLVADIKSHDTGRPKIIMGDMNCIFNRDKVEQLLFDALAETGYYSVKDGWIEMLNGGVIPEYTGVLNQPGKDEYYDKIMIVNDKRSMYQLKFEDFHPDTTYVWPEGTSRAGEELADHWPQFATISITRKGFSTDVDHIAAPENEVQDIYALSGVRLGKAQKGISIVRMKNGTTRKILR